MDTDTTTPDAALRDTMIENVKGMGWARRPEVERVLRDVRRHEFVPEADLDTAYNPWQAVITHRFSDGASLSCASAPFVVGAVDPVVEGGVEAVQQWAVAVAARSGAGGRELGAAALSGGRRPVGA